jgi:hypothetical protein
MTPTQPAATPTERRITPYEVKVLDMALRYSVISHDYSCPEHLDPYDPRYTFKPCSCPANGWRKQSIDLLRRLSEGLRKPSGDYIEEVQP